MFCNGLWRIGGNSTKSQSMCSNCIQIDIVETSTTQSNYLDSFFCKHGDYFGSEFIVYKNAHSIKRILFYGSHYVRT
ncbi:hypothetical protein D3C85_1175520 [compost metagenome]